MSTSCLLQLAGPDKLLQDAAHANAHADAGGTKRLKLSEAHSFLQGELLWGSGLVRALACLFNLKASHSA